MQENPVTMSNNQGTILRYFKHWLDSGVDTNLTHKQEALCQHIPTFCTRT